MSSRTVWAALTAGGLALALPACGDNTDGGTGGAGGGGNCPALTGSHAYYDAGLNDPSPAGAPHFNPLAWLAFPFPSDHRRTDTGFISLRDYPNPEREGTLRMYTSFGSTEMTGFGLNSPVYVAFNTALRQRDISANMATFQSATAPLQIIDITPSSPEYGMRRPLRWNYFTVDGKFVAPNTLAVAPAWGFPLRQATTYAFIMTDGIKDASGATLEVPLLLRHLFGTLSEDCAGPDATLLADLVSQFAPLKTLLESESFDTSSIVAATTFTTQEFTSELGLIYDHIQTTAAPTLDDTTWAELDGAGVYHIERTFQPHSGSSDRVTYYVMEARYQSPNYQVGDIPYAADGDGGQFNFVGGLPEPTHFENLRFRLTIPADPPAQGRPCYPIVEYAHGTGGSAEGFTSGQAGRHTAKGIATIGLDQPLHGPRWSGSSTPGAVELYSFNFFNPDAARTMFRQSAVDTFALTRFIRASLRVPASKSPTGNEICFDADRVMFMGHSHGGLSGALAAAFEKNITTWVLSGAGGGIAITAVERKDALANPEEILIGLLQPNPGEVFEEMHPVLSLVTLLAEVTDPINYAPFWLDQNDYSPPKHLFVTSGTEDEATPYRTATAMAVAGQVPIVGPMIVPAPEFGVAGLAVESAPVSGNYAAPPTNKTAGFMQWTNSPPGADASHWVIFNRSEAINAAARFFESSAYESAPRLERDPSSDAQ